MRYSVLKYDPLSRHREYFIVIIAAFIFTLYHAILTSLVIANYDEVKLSFLYVFGVEWLAFVPLGVSMIIVIWVSRRNPELFSTLTVSVLIKHLIFAAVLFTIHAFWQQFINSSFLSSEFSLNGVERDFMAFLEMRFLFYITVVGLVGGLIKMREHGTASVKESELRLELQKAKLRELELKMNPEIIYPNLEYIKEKAEKNPEEASQMVILMAGLLRKLVDHLEGDHIKLTDDIQFFTMYMDIVKLRKEQSINFETRIDGLSGNEKVPPMILLTPFLEELLFGKYKTYIKGISEVTYIAKRTNRNQLELVISMGSISTQEGLQEYLDDEFLIKTVNEQLSVFASDEFKFKVQVIEMKVILTLYLETTEEVFFEPA